MAFAYTKGPVKIQVFVILFSFSIGFINFSNYRFICLRNIS